MDVWFSGYNRDVVTTTWVGFDNYTPLGRKEFGGTAALPIWIEFMRLALKGVPENKLAMPEGMVSALIDKETGCPARAGQRNTTFEFFREGHIPECDDVDALPDIFNNAGSVDPDPEEDDDEESEPLF